MVVVRWSPFEISTTWSLTLVFRSAFWMVYPVISQLPSSVGGSHSSAALKPHTSVTLTFRGGPGFSALNWHILNISHSQSLEQPQRFSVVSYRQPWFQWWLCPPCSQFLAPVRIYQSALSLPNGWTECCPRWNCARWPSWGQWVDHPWTRLQQAVAYPFRNKMETILLWIYRKNIPVKYYKTHNIGSHFITISVFTMQLLASLALSLSPSSLVT